MTEHADRAAQMIDHVGEGAGARGPGRGTMTASLPPSARSIARALLEALSTAQAAVTAKPEAVAARPAAGMPPDPLAALRGMIGNAGAALGGGMPDPRAAVHAHASGGPGAALGNLGGLLGGLMDPFGVLHGAMGHARGSVAAPGGAMPGSHSHASHAAHGAAAAPGPAAPVAGMIAELHQSLAPALQVELAHHATTPQGLATFAAQLGDEAHAASAAVDPAARARHAATQATVETAIRSMNDLQALRELYNRLIGEVGGDPNAIVVAEVNGSFPMLRSNLHAVIAALEQRTQEVQRQMAPPPTAGPAASAGPASFDPGALPAPIGATDTHGIGTEIANDRHEQAEHVAHARHLSHGSALATAGEYGLEIAHVAHVGSRLASLATAGVGIVAIIGETVLAEVLFRSIEWSLEHTYDEHEFPAYVDHQVGPGITRNAHDFIHGVAQVMRGEAATGGSAAAAARAGQAQIAALRQAHPQWSAADIQTNAREIDLPGQLFDAIAPALRAAVDRRAGEIHRQHQRPPEELTALATALRRRVEAAR